MPTISVSPFTSMPKSLRYLVVLVLELGQSFVEVHRVNPFSNHKQVTFIAGNFNSALGFPSVSPFTSNSKSFCHLVMQVLELGQSFVEVHHVNPFSNHKHTTFITKILILYCASLILHQNLNTLTLCFLEISFWKSILVVKMTADLATICVLHIHSLEWLKDWYTEYLLSCPPDQPFVPH